MTHSLLSRVLWLSLGAAALPLAGCYAHATADPVWVEADYTPVNIDVYPRTVYEGRTVYLVHDHWYTRESGRWVYYRSEPVALQRQRVVVQQAPRAPERHAPPRRQVQRERPRHHDRDRDRDGDRARERREVHEAPPAFHRD